MADFFEQSEEDREFTRKLREMDERAAKKREQTEEAQTTAQREQARKLALRHALEKAARNAHGGKKDRDIAPSEHAEQPNDVEPESETGMYRVHIIHKQLNLKFDMLLNPKRVGAELYHGATITITKKDSSA